MGPGIELFLAMPLIFGLPLVCVGLILRLCEYSWRKEPGSMGSTGLLVAGGLLCLPFAVWLAGTVASNVISKGKPF